MFIKQEKRNLTFLSYQWGKVTKERLSSVVLLAFSVDKTADNRNFLLSLSLQLCIAGVCAPDIDILQDFTTPIPFCNPNGTLEWPQNLGNVCNILGSFGQQNTQTRVYFHHHEYCLNVVRMTAVLFFKRYSTELFSCDFQEMLAILRVA